LHKLATIYRLFLKEKSEECAKGLPEAQTSKQLTDLRRQLKGPHIFMQIWSLVGRQTTIWALSPEFARKLLSKFGQKPFIS
jgi:hypothetical protein